MINLVKLRGTCDVGANSPKILVQEIIRTDLCICFEKGGKPVLFTYEEIFFPLLFSPDHLISSLDPDHIESRLDVELSPVWAAMSDFVAQMNIAATNPAAQITTDTFVHAMGSILYRLFHLRYEEGTLDEYIRLGLLAFASPVFIDWKTIRWTSGVLIETWRQALDRILTESTLAPGEQIWLLMVGTISFALDSDFLARLKEGLRPLMEQCGIRTWNDLKELLGSYMWIGALFDRHGASIFGAVSAAIGEGPSLTHCPRASDGATTLLGTRPYSGNLDDLARLSNPECKRQFS